MGFSNILAMIFISRSEVTLLVDNREKFTYFLKAYGMSSVVYILSWVMYSMLLGALKFLTYIVSVYIYLKIR